MPSRTVSRSRRPRTVVALVLGCGVIVVVLAAGLASTMGGDRVGLPAVAVSREAAIKIAAANLGPEAILRSAELETMGATGLLAPPAGPDTLVWTVAFDGLTVPVCPPMGAPNATPTPCHSAAVQAVVIVNAQTGEILTTATHGI